MKIGKTLIFILCAYVAYTHFKEPAAPKPPVDLESLQQEKQDAQEFAQILIQRDFKCDKVTGFVPANIAHAEINVWCDDIYHYEITKPGGRWTVKAM
ncbi:TPA: hypothetical protein ACG1UU_003028 [Kluyvera ascorbata]